ncbi:MAG: Hsp33 family molecular chaperone HslO [Alphaproteobacteria bacterium]|nr:Hsp33 family molecular chaperone HslO [Alphaproteobacteria bacterium]
MQVDLQDDMILPFQLDSCSVRGRIVRLGPVLDTILGQHRYPDKVSRLLGDVTSLAAALGTALKFDGIFTIQTQTDGPVRRLVADVTSDGALRACAQFEEDQLKGLGEGTPLLGKGHLVMTVDQKAATDERYQGVVGLESDALIEAFQLYFRQSEQIPTGLFVATGQDAQGRWRSGCLMVQRMPHEGGHVIVSDTAVEDDWLRVMHLMQTCTADEILDPDLSASDLLYRLFHEEGVRVYDTLALRHACRCSRERIEGILASMPKDELETLRTDDGQLTVTCQFCGVSHAFTTVGSPDKPAD